MFFCFQLSIYKNIHFINTTSLKLCLSSVESLFILFCTVSNAAVFPLHITVGYNLISLRNSIFVSPFFLRHISESGLP